MIDWTSISRWVNFQNAEENEMALSDQLLEKLACPKCKGKLKYIEEENQLLCESCKLAYRITDNIPVLLIDEAEEYE